MSVVVRDEDDRCADDREKKRRKRADARDANVRAKEERDADVANR